MLTRVKSPPAVSNEQRSTAVVIGSGFGGLAAAIRLGARGYAVTILEKLDAPGGRAYVHKQDGFTFDAGPTIVTAPFLFEELWGLCGRKLADDVHLRPMEPFYRIRFHDGSHFDYSGDPNAMRSEIERISPADLPGYEAYMRESEAIYRIGFEQLGHVSFGSPLDMLRIAPDLVRRRAYRSVFDQVAKYIANEKLQAVFSFHPLLIGGNPFRVSAIYCLITHLEQRFGVHFAMGGTGRLVEGMVRLIEGQGGIVRYRAEVERILVKDGVACGVELRGGERIRADIVVSNADAAWTYRYLVPANSRRRWTNRKLDRSRYSMGLFVWYFGTSKIYPRVKHHTIFLGRRYRELIEDIFERKILASDFSLYLHRPTASDPSLAPSGCDTFYVLSPVPNLGGSIDWVERSDAYRKAIARQLDETELPGFEQHIVTSRVTTPLDFQDRLLSYRGAAFSLEPLLTQSAWFRPNNRSEDVKHLYLVGAGTHPGAGLPGVLSSARVLDTVVPDAAQFA